MAACARGRVALASAPAGGEGADVAAHGVRVAAPTVACADCGVDALGGEVIRAVAVRVADLKARGGACQAYGAVLEGSLASKRIVVRPFMWRVGGSLASAQASSTGEIDVARDVDALNVGRRSLDEVVHSVEHEAVHIAFAIPSGAEWNEMLVNERVEGCRSRSAVVGATP
ncbi:MAG: hypothetical protein Q8K55_00290 [Gemmatimonadaceae bacterium]|nr:hypothetical protein [Gemmatimonadaceae bacterium]